MCWSKVCGENREVLRPTQKQASFGYLLGTGSEMLYKTAVVVSVTLGRLDSKRYSMQGWRGQLGRSAFVKPRYPSVLEVEGGASCMLRICHGVP